MSTLQTVIVCITSLAAIAIVSNATVEAKRASADQLGSPVLAGQIAAAIAGKQNDVLRDVLGALDIVADNTTPAATGTPAPILVGQSVVVHTRKPDDQSVRGIVAAHYADELVLREAAYLQPGGRAPRPADGEVRFRWSNVSSVQELTPTEVV